VFLIELFLQPRDIAEGADGGIGWPALGPEGIALEFQMRLNFGSEILSGTPAAEHGLSLRSFRTEDAPNSGGKAPPTAGFASQLSAAGGTQTIKARFPIVGGGAPFRGDPALLFQALQGRVESAMLDQEFVLGGLLDGAGNPLTVLGTEGEGTEDEEVESTLEEGEAVFIRSGRHFTQEYDLRWSVVNPCRFIWHPPGAAASKSMNGAGSGDYLAGVQFGESRSA
jgi:hypothetical protein